MQSDNPTKVCVIDSHTGGEPTRLVISGAPDLGSGSMAERLHRFRHEHDSFRSAVVNEPRGSDVMVGALLCEPSDPSCVAGVIFFNNVGYLGMCGHGSIGTIVSLAHMGKIGPGKHYLETPVGVVSATLHDSCTVTIDNVVSFRAASNVSIEVPGFGPVCGDVAWGGNWFFLAHVDGMELTLRNLDQLTEFTWKIRETLRNIGITGSDGQEIDHVELFAPSSTSGIDSRNFVLCPGKAYDRSPCGTGTSAKLACLYADGKLQPGEIWKQESIIGSVFEGSIRVIDGKVHPSIKGTAYVNAKSELVLDPRDPFAMGIRV